MSNQDKAKREVLATELGQLKDKYSQLKQNYDELKRLASSEDTQGLLGQAQGQIKDTFYQEANIEV